ncbi:MarR family winged helix-turn-helix transcriptional regulator [Paenibacillus mucilaginosus]|uniref:Transcriptional regulator, MarR family n=1 Tax=Paenibacillus mucilaginosus (strain KNP414) TaxID=1036673 RepID=F8FEX4_PAEMK|nr:MarR family transcriptional regulator [Paenibacillus mucilaginosus]AEI46209.1 transcriptional regulator, MarR family [Paenibacillus mucilaginosus KNP414]MCG7213661.1 MarR family transcriptional regulator [Paenibacillus mucilaginosus]WDM27533.1 MarR family transcriptional regulator [Paenibacillus mucilaginosus]
MTESQTQDALLQRLEEVHRQLQRRLITRWNAESPMMLTRPQANLLLHMEDRGPLSMSALTEFLGVTSGAATFMCDKLVEKGLIERARQAGDRRVVSLQLTGEGLRTTAAIRELKRTFGARLFDGVTEEELSAVDRVFRTALQNLTK